MKSNNTKNILNVCNDTVPGSMSTIKKPVNGQRGRNILRFNAISVKEIQDIYKKKNTSDI